MKYPESYLLTRDIDWFFKLNGKPIHVVSAGGILPKEINDRNKLREIQYKVSNLETINTEEEIQINEKLFKYFPFPSNTRNDYLRSFIEMAKKGFISVDRTNIEDPNDCRYHLVCIPKKLYCGEELELENIVAENIDISLENDSFDMSQLFEEELRLRLAA